MRPHSSPPVEGRPTERPPNDAAEGLRRELEPRPRVALLVSHPDGAEMVALDPDVAVVVGRERPSDLCVADATLSREHARFTLTGGRVLVEDLGSTNGTWLAGRPVRVAEVKPGDEVTLGGLTACVHTVGPGERDLGLEGHERFLVRIEEEVVRANHFRGRFAVLMVRAPSPALHAWRWAPWLRAALRPVDRMALYSRDAVQIVLPDADDDLGLEVARAITAQQSPEVPALLVGVALFPGSARAADKLVELSRGAAKIATIDHPVQVAPATRWVSREPGDARAGGARSAGAPLLGGRAMREVIEMVARLKESRIPVILHGETGTGKEILARLIHDGGLRQKRPMVCVNSGAIAPQLVESFFFGHERGAFTGASQQQKGVFEEADGGTVFLDEIGELPLAAQTALLRVLETRRVTRVGSNKEIAVDVRIIAATHCDLEAMSEQGSFRADLLYRMNTMTLPIPPLRERIDEIEALALRFLAEANEANRRDVRRIEPQAMALLHAYRWPGNVRELRNAIERAVVIARSDVIRAHELPARVRAAGGARESVPTLRDTPTLVNLQVEVEGPASSRPGGARNLKERLVQYETQIILATLRTTRWNQTEAAKELGMPLRTLVHKIKVLGIKRL